MKIPQPFQYQGSKRALASVIMQYLPAKMERIIEPFAGSAALSIACASNNKAREYWINDFNKPLAELLSLVINHPQTVIESYKNVWVDEDSDHIDNFYRVREDFNRSHDPCLLLYLLARCVKGSVRYNADGLFNQSPDKRRLGTHPTTLKTNILAVSNLLKGKSIITSSDYRDVLVNCKPSDVVYMDPPYQGVCGDRDSRYFSGIEFEGFVTALSALNKKGVRYLISYDGRLGDRSYGTPLPDSLKLTLIELEAGRSTQSTFLGRKDVTFESLYLSEPLAKVLNAKPCTHYRYECSQMELLEGKAHYATLSKRVS